MRLKKLIVKNFKSLHDCEIELGKFNVLIGVNASGKSNLVEIFKLLRKIYVEKDSNPFLEWWGYNNVVWQRKEELPITIGMLFDVEGYDVYFETTFTGTGGRFQILREILDIRGYVKIEKEGTLLRIVYNPKWLGNALSKLPPSIENWIWNITALQEFEKEYVLPTERKEKSMLDLCSSIEGVYSQDHTIAYSICYPQDFRNRKLAIPVITPVIESTHKMRSPLYFEIVLELHRFFAKTKILKQIYLQNIKIPQFSRKEITLNEDASNLIPLLYNIWLREGRLPEEIETPLRIIFPNTRVFFQLTEDGRVMIKVFENGLELAPPSISDGFYKILALQRLKHIKRNQNGSKHGSTKDRKK